MTERKRRRTLNVEQLTVLELLYKFRFGSNDLFAQYFGKKDRSFVFKRLSILLEQGYIGKRFDSSYRIQGKPAAYYLTPAGARKIAEHRTAEDKPVNFKIIYKNQTVKEQFVRHCMDIFKIYNQLKAQYGSSLAFFTASDLNYEEYRDYPQPLPDAYLCLDTKQGEKQFFLDIYYGVEPFFKAVRRIKNYIDYAKSANWHNMADEMPTVLALCESDSLQKRLQKRTTSQLNKDWSADVTFALTTKVLLASDEHRIWQPATESDKRLSLVDIQ